ncbi:penicillin-binding transpeptidase domain-containing protein [Candidatus Oleimmundimicrobium sp.]|uniref:peptidoglycan D,D-transpeptidase FtsI family protein n=1 Tax=Candidatus Oleimmundimicrobium sp. TaxID=3060597 RepID=UPI00271ADA5B|nr:penicillin-binding transpeptidase domain-containing protein [Candidatus Oleimmundimicrobium sp.]MDO8886811.1 penicillin-binding transpeptidase domain-containing protein [Candidatus Oleimmundimicrobium sp.]
MNKRLYTLGIFFSIVFVVLIINLTYLQVFAAHKIVSHPENKRSLAKDASIERGKIFSSDGELLADNTVVNNTYVRIYPQEKITSALVGFNDITYGRAGIELTYNDYLLGRRTMVSAEDYIKKITGDKVPGNDVTLTINFPLQKEAFELLADKRGAIVVLNPKTGAILAMATNPTFDPNNINENWTNLIKDSSAPLINRGAQGLYPPGSSFKIITASAAVDSGISSPASIYKGPGEIKISGNTISNYDKKDFGEIPLNEAFALSVNTVFAQIGLELGAKQLVEYAENFGFNHKIPFDLSVNTSTIPSPNKMDEVALAWSSVGQANVLATPLQMALAGASIANKGTIMKPCLIKEIRDHNDILIRKFESKKWLKPISEASAIEITDMMIKVVEDGTGKAAQIPNVKVAGKTGTAEVANDAPHAWFIGFAPAENPQVVVVVIIENSGYGGKVTAPIAKKIIQKALREIK